MVLKGWGKVFGGGLTSYNHHKGSYIQIYKAIGTKSSYYISIYDNKGINVVHRHTKTQGVARKYAISYMKAHPKG